MGAIIWICDYAPPVLAESGCCVSAVDCALVGKSILVNLIPETIVIYHNKGIEFVVLRRMMRRAINFKSLNCGRSFQQE
jgi:hypothetical protein